MADAFTGTAAVDYEQTAYNRYLHLALRPQLHFDEVADVQATRQAMPGAAVIFTIQNDLAAVTAPASETVDVDAVALSDSQVTVTLAEYVNAVNTTAKLRATAFIDVMEAAAKAITFNAAISLDGLARTAVVAGTNVRYGGTAVSRVTVAAGHTMTAALVQRSLVDLQDAFVMPFDDGYYKAIIHPDVAYDLRRDTDVAAWRIPHDYSQPGEIWRGEIGEFEGFRFAIDPRTSLFADAGVGGTVDVYATLFFGQQSLAKAYSVAEDYGPYPTVVVSPIVDKAKRFKPLAWKWLGAYGRFREAALRRVETSSSIGAN